MALPNINPEKIEKACGCLKALAHPIRLQVLMALKDGEKNVQQLENLLETSQANMSQHLRQMKEKQILSARRDANQVFYTVRDERTFLLLELLQTIYCKP
jgi:DNA-binding transcriptional ArsR family regulator